MRYLLDTNIVSDLMRRPQGAAAQRLGEVGDANVCTSVVVAAELWYGAAKKASQRLMSRVSIVLAEIEVVPLESDVAQIYGELRATLERRGRSIGPNDLLVAAQSIALGFTLVSDNEREFGRIAGLTVENWLR